MLFSKKRLYLDESGDHSIRGVTPARWDKRYLCLFGCALELDYCHKTFHVAFEGLKSGHFGGDPDDPIILHREEVKARGGSFAVLRDPARADAFNGALLDLTRNTQFRAFAVVIDKLSTQSKHFAPIGSHPYHIGLLAMLERYCGWLRFSRSTGDVLAESRGTREDMQLKAAYKTVHSAGTNYHPAEFFQNVLTSKEIKIKPKSQNIGALQFADLLAYPAKRQILSDFGLAPPPTGYTKDMADTLEHKWNSRYATGQVVGYGKIMID
jgi:hypothetical protein